MKKLLLAFAVVFSLIGYSQGHETFENFDRPGTSYGDGTFEGQDGSTWTYGQCRGDIELNGTAITLGRNRSSDNFVESGTISGGMGVLEFSYMQAFGNNVSLQVYVNDVLVHTATSNNEQNIIKSSGPITVNVEGNVELKFTKNQNSGQVTIDDITWTSFGSGGGDPGVTCSQATPSNDLEDGYGHLHLLILANDFIVEQGQEFTLDKIKTNFIVNAGISVASANFTFYESTSSGPGSLITSQTGIVPTSQNVIEPLGAFDLKEMVFDLTTPLTFSATASSDKVYWMGINISYSGTQSFMEISSTYSTPNETYISLDNGTTWESTYDDLLEYMHGVIEYSGTCADLDGGGDDGPDCAQGDDSNGFENGYNIEAGGIYRIADDFFVSAGTTLTVQQIELNIFADDPPSTMNFNFYNDNNGSPGSTLVHTLTGIPVESVAIGSNFGFVVYSVFADVNLDFPGGASGSRYWMQPESDSDFVYWEVTSAGSLGAYSHVSENNGPWESDEDFSHGVFKLHCTPVTIPDPVCLFSVDWAVEPITRIIVSNIDNASSPTSTIPLEDFTDVIIYMEAGESYPVAVEGTTSGEWTNYITAFVDLSGDWSEYLTYPIGSITNSNGSDGQQATSTIDVPANAVDGTYTVRIIKNFDESPTNPCGIYDFGQGEDYTLVIGAISGCTGTPDAGTTAVSPSSGNGGSAYTVSNTGHTFADNMTFQWQSNTNNAGWTDAGTASSGYAAYHATAPSELGTVVEWRLKVTCDTSSETAYSTPATFTVVRAYCTPTLDCSDGDVIYNVTFQEIDNDSDCSANGYGDYTDQVAVVQSGGNYPIDVTVGDGWSNEAVSVWIDFNDNGTFDENEFFFIGVDSGSVVSGNIAIPAGTANGMYRMRVRVAAVGATTATWDMACDSDQFYGETEDYTVQVDGVAGVADFSTTGLSYYPNPANDVLHIVAGEKISTVSAFNVLGQEILNSKNFNQGKMDVSALPQGTYIFKVGFETGATETFKVLIK